MLCSQGNEKAPKKQLKLAPFCSLMVLLKRDMMMSLYLLANHFLPTGCSCLLGFRLLDPTNLHRVGLCHLAAKKSLTWLVLGSLTLKWEEYHLPRSVVVVVVQLLSCVWHFATPWTIARQASLSITSSQSLLKLVSIELVTPSSHLILSRPLLLLRSVFPCSSVFSNESALCIKWPKYWSFSFSPSSEHPGTGCLNSLEDGTYMEAVGPAFLPGLWE